MSLSPRWLLLSALGLAAACDGSAARSSDAGASPGPRVDAAPNGAFRAASCTSSESAPGVTVSCGTVRVPERHDDPSVGEISLRVATLSSPTTAAAEDPIVLLDGGAGGSSIASALYYAGWAADRSLRMLLARRRVVAIDLRGTGGSTPHLGCDAGGIEPLTRDDADLGARQAALADCRRQVLGTGATLGAYGTPASARDVSAVVAALGLGRYHLVGVSYGARVALEVLRDPAAASRVRAVVLDSVSPPGTDVLAQEGAGLARALGALVAACEADVACKPRAAGLRTAVPEIVARLAREPVEVNSHGGAVTLDERTFLQALAMALREGDTEGLLPKHLESAMGGDFGYFAALLAAPRGRGSLGAHLGIMCAEHMAFTSAEQIEASAATVAPPLANALYARYYAFACPLWDVPSAPAALRAQVSARVPALILSGGLDPGGSPAGAAEVAATLTGARTIELGRHGHAVLHRTCGALLAARFLDDPATPLTAGACLSPE